MFHLQANKVNLSVLERETVTTGSVNVYPVRFTFSADWDGLDKTAVFRVGAESRSVRLGQDGTCVVPWEVLTQDAANRALYIGVYGVRDEMLVLPTVWANAGTILCGASPGEEAAPPTPGLYEQIVEQFRSMSEQTLSGAEEILTGAEAAAEEAKESAALAGQSASNAERSAQAASDTLDKVQKAASTAAEEAAKQATEALQGYLTDALTAEQNARLAEQGAAAAKENAEAAAREAIGAALSAGTSATAAERLKDETFTDAQAAESAATAAQEAARKAAADAEAVQLARQDVSTDREAAEKAAEEAGDILAEVKQLSPVGPVTLPTQSGTLTYNGEPQYPLWAGYDPKKLLLGGVTFARDAGTYTATFTPRGNCTWTEGGTESRTVEWSIAKAAGEVTAAAVDPAITLRHPVGKIHVVRSGDGAVSAKSGSPEVAEVAVNGTEISVTGISSGHAEITVSVGESGNYLPSETVVSVEIQFAHVFGVTRFWSDENTESALERLTVENDPYEYVTADVTEEPVPAVGSVGGSSPFDTRLPWSGMKEYNILPDGSILKFGEEGFSRTEHDTLVFIPEFWYNVEYREDKEAGTAQHFWYIADEPYPGFEKHPGSGRYVGRYEAGAVFDSKSGSEIMENVSRAMAREGIRAKGDGWYLYDYATYCAIILLYLVEYADFDSQTKVGFGIAGYPAGKGVIHPTGETDAMAYHTGSADGEDKKSQVQYRHIEGLWGNVGQLVDGINCVSESVVLCRDPDRYDSAYNSADYETAFSNVENTNGTVKKFAMSQSFPWAFYEESVVREIYTMKNIYIADFHHGSGGLNIPVLGDGSQSGISAGLFAMTRQKRDGEISSKIGVRLIYLPEVH